MTYIRTWSGWAYVAFVLDVYSRMIVGWQVAGHMRTELPLDALEMALWRRRIKKDSGLIHHSDRGTATAGRKVNSTDRRNTFDRRGVQWDYRGSRCRRRHPVRGGNG
ncbi:DDE-type integrase/transposase/recombinase, partial [Streptomyces sp. NRRL S-813]|uniref:DDE-type integrase/transposase/recombinase n=1 Tax=Streptomyces sp. NRRL S-813 TaxID=1463919 RepID=UPI003B6390A1